MTSTVTEPTIPAVLPADVASRLRHDLRTPINHILGFAELMIEEADDSGLADAVESLRTIVAIGRQALGLVDSARLDDRAALATLGHRLDAPMTRLVSICEALDDGGPAGGDLATIRAAAVRLIELTGRPDDRD